MENLYNLLNDSQLSDTQKSLIEEIKLREQEKILEPENAALLIKLIKNAENNDEAQAIAALGTTYKRTGFHFDKRLEKHVMSDTIKYFEKNKNLSFGEAKEGEPIHKLIIGDNYDALNNLLIQYRKKVDVIYIDPPYAKDSLGNFAQENYTNAISRDNLLSMLYFRLQIAKQLLSDDGVIFCSIDDRNHSYVKCLFDEIFGESCFLLNVPRQTKKGGKTTTTIAKNNDYIIGYTLSRDIIFSQEEIEDLSKYKYEDEFVEERGKYALTQTLDYNSLGYSTNMDFPIEFDGRTFIPGGDENAYHERLKGFHGVKDWTWRWGKDAVKWAKENSLLELKGNRIYTKSYLKCRKKNGKCELEFFDEKGKAFTTLSYIENEYSNDNANKELARIFLNSSQIFRNPKGTVLVKKLIEMVCNKKDAIILDFFAGSGTTGHAVLELNKDGGKRTFLLCQINEATDTTPNGIAYDVTSKRMKRVMTGECYDGNSDFKWIKENKPYGGKLDVYEIREVSNNCAIRGKTPFDVIDETLYGLEKFKSTREKIEWVCQNFSHTQMVEPKED